MARKRGIASENDLVYTSNAGKTNLWSQNRLNIKPVLIFTILVTLLFYNLWLSWFRSSAFFSTLPSNFERKFMVIAGTQVFLAENKLFLDSEQTIAF